MIGMRTGGVFSDETDMGDLKARVSKIVAEMEEGDFPTCLDVELVNMSQELIGSKESCVIIAEALGASEFCKRLSLEFGTEIMLMSWDEEVDEVQCQIFLDGKSLCRVPENPIKRILRRTA
jgi:hypothetical protein